MFSFKNIINKKVTAAATTTHTHKEKALKGQDCQPGFCPTNDLTIQRHNRKYI